MQSNSYSLELKEAMRYYCKNKNGSLFVESFDSYRSAMEYDAASVKACDVTGEVYSTDQLAELDVYLHNHIMAAGGHINNLDNWDVYEELRGKLDSFEGKVLLKEFRLREAAINLRFGYLDISLQALMAMEEINLPKIKENE